jgi:signal peptidase
MLFFLYQLYVFISVLISERSKKLAAANAASAPVIDEEEIKKRAIEEYIKRLEAAKVDEALKALTKEAEKATEQKDEAAESEQKAENNAESDNKDEN